MHAVTNEQKDDLFPIQNLLRSLTAFPNNYVIGVFDCCRTIIPTKKKGLEEGSEEIITDIESSFIFYFMAYSGRATDAEQEASKDFYEMLLGGVNRKTNELNLPMDMLEWAGNNHDAPQESLVKSHLILKFNPEELDPLAPVSDCENSSDGDK